MGKWSVMDLIGLNAGKQDFEQIYLSPYEVEPSESNFYSQENIAELADSIRMVGQQQPTVLGRVGGAYKIISGHRRNLANIHNIETGAFPRDYKAKYLVKDMTPAMMELSLIIGNAFNRRLTPYEETEQAARLKAALIRARDEDGAEIPGKLRDMVADILQVSQTRVARMDKINNGLVPEAREQFKVGSLGPSAAYETAKLPQEDQREIAAKAAAGEEVKHKDIAERVAEKKAEQAAARTERAEKKAKSAGFKDPHASEESCTTRDRAVYRLCELMDVVNYITDDDLITLQGVLMAASERKENGKGCQDKQADYGE